MVHEVKQHRTKQKVSGAVELVHFHIRAEMQGQAQPRLAQDAPAAAAGMAAGGGGAGMGGGVAASAGAVTPPMPSPASRACSSACEI